MIQRLKPIAVLALFGSGVAVLAGCPIYPSDGSDGCYDGPCYGGGVPGPKTGETTCSKPSDCPAGENCGSDRLCHAGDCSETGCPTSFVCKLSGGRASCVPTGGGGEVDGGGGSTSDCQNDGDCGTPAGSRCLSGACVPPQDLCADTTQCPDGSRCVDGACTQACGGTITKPCPTGYACDAQKGVCTENQTPCTSSSSCTAGNVCVQEHCVAPCTTGGTCPGGQVCVDGGCTPDEKPVFTCATDGVQDACQPGSLCLRHSCYIACDADASASCQSADEFNVCKSVTTTSGTHSVCGSSSNLGTECDPTQNKACTGALICIDGFCR